MAAASARPRLAAGAGTGLPRLAPACCPFRLIVKRRPIGDSLHVATLRRRAVNRRKPRLIAGSRPLSLEHGIANLGLRPIVGPNGGVVVKLHVLVGTVRPAAPVQRGDTGSAAATFLKFHRHGSIQVLLLRSPATRGRKISRNRTATLASASCLSAAAGGNVASSGRPQRRW